MKNTWRLNKSLQSSLSQYSVVINELFVNKKNAKAHEL